MQYQERMCAPGSTYVSHSIYRDFHGCNIMNHIIMQAILTMKELVKCNTQNHRNCNFAWIYSNYRFDF